eukprot:XP_001698496.1 predicted protein [Chlamydomonas reinhardtii]
MTLEMRRKLLCATAASGDLENLELAASVVGCPLGPDVFTAARAAGHGEVLGWLRSAGLTDTDASLEAAGRAGHPNCSPSCIIAAAGAGHSVCGRLRSINSLEERMNIALAAAAAAAGGGHAAECDRLLQLHKEMRDGFLGLHPAVPAFEAENFPQLQAAGVRLLEAAVEGLGLGELAALYGRVVGAEGSSGSGGGEPQGEGEVQQTAEVCTAAARSGSLELLALVRARGCPWGPEAVAAGAAAGCEAVLAYLVAQGCPAGDCHDAYAAAIAAEDLLTLRCLRRLGLPWSGDAATWRAHAIRCGVPLLRWLHEEAQVPVLDWMRSLGNRRDGRRTEQLSRRVTEWYAGEEAKAAEVRRQRLRQDEEEMQRLQGKKWWRRAAVPSESPKTPSGSGPQQRSLESTAQLARDTGNHHVLRWVSERIALANIWRIGR